MNRVVSLAVVLLFSLSVLSQDKTFTVSGKVIDAKSGAVLTGASVFCQNTTVGTISKADGSFFLRLANGGYDMIVSYTGYETKQIRISKDNKENDSLTVELKEADKAMEQVVVAGSAEVADGWDKYGQFFIDNFIGTTPNAGQCIIENKEALKFYYYKKRNKLRVKTKEDLVITNNALGYRIRYQLDSFVYDYNTNISSYTGYPLFEKMTGTAQQDSIWQDKRFYTYTGSRLHFIRSWYDSTLKEEGFVLEMPDSSKGNAMKLINNPYDSRFYTVDSGDVEINLPGKLRVSYTKQQPDRRYLQEFKFPLSTKAEISALSITDGFVIEENGYFYDQADVINVGYWSWKKLAELLPYDYLPE